HTRAHAGLSQYHGALADAVAEFLAGVRSGVSYCGGHTIPAAREQAEFIQVAASAAEREGAHGIAGVEELVRSETADGN
ncbi:IMP dehydrogenase, partial [Halobacterium salinarum]|nr:IMP dehydrogenase [Halobacterium salinarum]